MFIGLLAFDSKYPADIAFSLYLTLAGIFNIINAWILPAASHLKMLKNELGESESEKKN